MIVLAIMFAEHISLKSVCYMVGDYREYEKQVEWGINLLVAAAIIFRYIYLFNECFLFRSSSKSGKGIS